jgi:hypothetical protein
VAIFGPSIAFGLPHTTYATTTTAAAPQGPSVLIRANPFNPSAGELAAFVRFGDAGGSGIFLSVTNPFTTLVQANSGGGGGGNSSCVKGINYRNGDLPGSPVRGVPTAAACQVACEANPNCVAFVWNAAGCDGGTPPPGNCFLKAKLTSKASEACSCTGTKPFPPPLPPPPPPPGPPPTPPAVLFAALSASYSAGDPLTARSPQGYYTTDEGVIGLTVAGQHVLPKYDTYSVSDSQPTLHPMHHQLCPRLLCGC